MTFVDVNSVEPLWVVGVLCDNFILIKIKILIRVISSILIFDDLEVKTVEHYLSSITSRSICSMVSSNSEASLFRGLI